MRHLALVVVGCLLASPVVAAPHDPPPGHDFTPIGKRLLVVGACGDGPAPEGYSAAMIEKHCGVIKRAQQEYLEGWVKPAREFFAHKVPQGLPTKVVYPFAGGDLGTALTVYPNAEEITTMSLEPAGDPRTLEVLNAPAIAAAAKAKPDATPKVPKALEKALGTVQYELKFLYRVNFSNTLNMIEAMRGGALPTQLIFGLSALKTHGYEVVSLRYFKLDAEGNIQYLTDADVAKAPDPRNTGTAGQRNRIFANSEIRFRKGSGPIQIHRHIQVNLDNDHLKKDPRVLKHLQAKGKVAAMTKAASYLISWQQFTTIRKYLIDNVVWMVSDATGVPPKYGKPAGFEYETYGQFVGPHIGAGNQASKDWRAEFEAQPRRELKFRFGYYDAKLVNHLVIMRKKS